MPFVTLSMRANCDDGLPAALLRDSAKWRGQKTIIIFRLARESQPLYSKTTSTDVVFSRTVKDKAQHAVLLDKNTSEKLYKDVQSYRLVTVATLVDRLKVNGSLARKCLKDLEEKGQIKSVVTHSKMKIYSMSTKTSSEHLRPQFC